MKTLYLVWALDNDKKMTLTLKQPKDDLTLEDIQPIMQQAITDNVFLVGTARVVESVDAYIREVTTTDLMP